MHLLLSLPVSQLTGPLLNGHPYLDPGTGSFILQIVIASVLGGAFLLRSYIARGFRAIKRMFVKTEADPETTTPETKENDVQ